MFQFQSHLIFPVHAVPMAGRLPDSAERLSVCTPDGQTLQGVHIPPDHPNREGVLILGFGGNAWNGQDVAEYLHELYPDVDVVTFHFRGYAPSTGSPSAEALIADAAGHAWEWTVPESQVAAVRADHVTTGMQRRADGVRLRLVAERAPSADAVPVAPSLEDAHLWRVDCAEPR